MKDLGEEHSMIIIWELIPSPAFGSSLFNLYLLWGSLACISRCETFLQEETWFLISWSPLGLSQFNIIPRLSPSLFFLPTLEAKALLFHT